MGKTNRRFKTQNKIDDRTNNPFKTNSLTMREASRLISYTVRPTSHECKQTNPKIMFYLNTKYASIVDLDYTPRECIFFTNNRVLSWETKQLTFIKKGTRIVTTKQERCNTIEQTILGEDKS